MAIRDEIKVQTDKLKDMDNKQKAEYIWTYYKLWFIAAAVLIIIVTSTIKGIVANSKPVYLEAIFLNSDMSPSADDPLAADFMAAAGVDPKLYRMIFDYTGFLSNEMSDQTAIANQVKLVSRYTAGEIDVCIGPENIMTGAADVGGYTNMEEALPAELFKKLVDAGYEPFYYTEKIYDDYPDKNGETHYVEGETYIGGFYVDKCPKLTSEFGIYSREAANSETNGRIVLTIAHNVPNLDHAIEFILYLTEQ